jgi:hypothetical protein
MWFAPTTSRWGEIRVGYMKRIRRFMSDSAM